MHMADALLSPAVGGGMWAVTAGLIGVSSRRIRKEFQETRIPLMGVAGAFVFAAQMINFTIPLTGSSGHIGGGLLLAILLGPWAGFLVMASILVVQALFFADGGLLALGCNIFNLGFWTCFIVYPLLYKPIVGSDLKRSRIFIGSLIGAVAGLQLGAFSVVLETVFSGITELPFGTFVLAMQPIHLAIGIVEGLITAAVVLFIHQHRPQVLQNTLPMDQTKSIRFVALSMLAAAVLAGGIVSWFASAHPDGLEWSMSRVSGKEELESPEEGIHTSLAQVQEKTAILPDYALKGSDVDGPQPHWPAVDAGTTLSGLLGGLLTLTLAISAGVLLKLGLRKKSETAVS
jgi:cobalt/nickel transport system permease protein